MTAPNVFTTVTLHAARALGETPERIADQPQLDRYPAFSSFLMVDLIEGLEEHYRITCDPADLTPANLRDARNLSAMVERAIGAQHKVVS